MYYSLISRFRGALVGSYLGETFDFHEYETCQSAKHYELISLGIVNLIESNLFEIEDWVSYQQKIWYDLDSTEGLPLRLVSTFLPTVLFFHDNPIKLRHVLLSAAAKCDYSSIIQDGILAITYIISQSLRMKLCVEKIITETIDFIGQTSTDLPQSLSQISNLVDSNASLEQAVMKLSNYDPSTQIVAIAFYCFLSTLEDFQLSILRSSINSPLNGLSAIVGALSGSQNSVLSIPSKWLSKQLEVKSAIISEITDCSKMLELADILMTIWSGAGNSMLYSRKTNYSLHILTSVGTMHYR
ncbi:MAG: ADP-ribosylglycohydrolase family protein [Cyanobacteria bacterium P01_A01_bin.45]